MPAPSIAAVRGAIDVGSNDRAAILEASARLLTALLERNGIASAQVVSAIFTATPDLDADFPAHAARRLGWTAVPLLCAQEIPVRGALPRTIRVLLTVTGAERDLRPVYLDGAASLRPDLAGGGATAAKRTVAIVGLGQIGGSLGLALGAAGGWRRVGYDRSAPVRRAARARWAVDEAPASLGAACAGADLAIVAVPVDVMPDVIDRVAAALPRGAALVDTGSARGEVTPALRRAARSGVRAVGGHPLAGTAGHGIAAARGDLFAGAGFVLMPAGRGVPPIVRQLVHAVGARPLAATPADHDRALARTSHLPYLVAVGLAGVGGTARRRGLSGPTFRDMTRVATSDARVALAYCRANATSIAAAWKDLRSRLDRSVARLAPRRARPTTTRRRGSETRPTPPSRKSPRKTRARA